MIIIKDREHTLKIDDLKFEKSDRKSSFFYVEETIIDLKNSRKKTDIEKFLERLLVLGIKRGASDIHIEPLKKHFKIRYRVDGVLTTIETLDIYFYPSLVSRMKLLCGLDITERRLPQDGRFKLTHEKEDYDLRVGIIPTYLGEKIVIRILDKKRVYNSLEEIGFSKKNHAKLFEIIKKRSGMIIFTGPMGSGKTTSMYGILNELNNEKINITTIEDPVEYSIEGINQIQIQPEIGLDFSTILKGILRQDTDIIMLGEIRDKETAEIALRASLTGHLVITTLHTNSCASTIKRLIDLNLQPYIISAGLKGIQNQRLVRKLCPICKTIDEDFMEKLKLLGKEELRFRNKIFYTHNGCSECCGTGYIGRIMIGEFLYIDDRIAEDIETYASIKKINEDGVKKGMIPLVDDGISKALLGITSLDEVIREC